MRRQTTGSVAHAIDFIEANLSERTGLDQVARELHYSRYHLHRMFAGTVGMTIHEYGVRRRLTEAARLLVIRQAGKNHLLPDQIPAMLDSEIPQQALVSALRKYGK